MFWQVIAVAGGGALGATARFLIGRALAATWPQFIGGGTLLVNLVGSLLIGFLLARGPSSQLSTEWRAFLVPGLLGGLTTFSALSWETVELGRSHPGWGAAHLSANVCGGLLAVLLGEALARRWFGV